MLSMTVVASLIAAHRRDRRSSSPATSIDGARRRARPRRPPTTTWRTSAAAAANTTAATRSAGLGAGEPDGVEPDRRRGRPARRPRCARPPASRGWRSRPPSPRSAARRVGGCRARRDASRSSSSTARASSNRSITACESRAERTARRRRRAARASGRCRRRGRARSSGRGSTSPARRSSAMSRVVEVGGVDRGEALAERAGAVEQPGRRAAVARPGTARSRPAARTRGRAAARRAPRPTPPRPRSRRVDGAHGVDRRADPRTSSVVQRARPRSAHARRVAVAEAPLHRVAARRRSRRAGSRCRAA